MIRIRRLEANNFKLLTRVSISLPPRGRFLVQGLNESGKSTLFEAVYFGMFGKPLVTATARPRLDDLIAYGETEALVALDLDFDDGRRLAIRRTIVRGKPNLWELDVARPGASVELVRNNAPVNERIAAELGFDGEALLNTCFVEQKKLDKLEGMTRAQREASLMKLLNLDRMVDLADELKVRSADVETLRRARAKARLGDWADRLPRLEAALRIAQAASARWRLAEALDEVDRRRADVESRRGALGKARRQELATEGNARAAEALRAAVGCFEALTAARERLDTTDAQWRGAAARLAALEGDRDGRAPQVIRRGNRLRRLGRAMRRAACWEERAAAARLSAEASRAAAEAAAEAGRQREEVARRLVEVRAEMHDAARDVERLEGDDRAFDVRDALGAMVGFDKADPEADRRLTSARMRLGWNARGAVRDVALLLVVVGLAWVGRPVLPPGWAAWVIGGLAVLALVRGIREARDRAAVGRDIARLEGELSAREEDRWRRRDAAAARLGALNAVVPSTEGRAREALLELDGRLAGRERDAVREGLTERRADRDAARRALDALVEEEAGLRAAARSFPSREETAAGVSLEDQAARMSLLAGRWRRRAESLAGGLEVAPAPGALEREIGAVEEELRRLRRQAGTIPAAASEAAALENQVRELRDRAQGAYGDLRGALAAVRSMAAAADAEPLASIELPATLEAADDPSLAGVGDALRAADAAAGGRRVADARDAAARGATRLETQLQAAQDALVAKQAEAVEALGRCRQLEAEALSVGLPGGAGPEPASLQAPLGGLLADAGLGRFGASRESVVDPVAGELQRASALAHALAAAPPPDRIEAAVGTADWYPTESAGEVEALANRVQEQINVARHEIRRLESDVGTTAAEVELEDAGAAAEEVAHALEVRDRASRIVSEASRNVVRNVLPSTLEHLRLLLPTLTGERYFDARLADDYQIEVWDDRAGDWKKKNIFSGGTRDQMSLALRLAFALATLPEERGSAPSFLFLDEPLGGFDRERAGHLVHLLMEGSVAESFDQIFLISHTRVDPELFDARIVMSEGRVVEADLGETAV